MMKKYISTATLCELYELDSMFFLRRKKDGVFQEKEHYIQQGNTLRWDIEKIESWWRGHNQNLDMIINKVL